ncbi:MAG TPA: phosphotransferase [Ensifer sp.]|uniref:phosphotransferase n=1 Tax=Ensifer sp. TaxID=1872086 RepID=UPI002E11B748|nr:phosphotransferase [Ensifer sp.]
MTGIDRDWDRDWLSSRYARGFTDIDLVTGGVNRTYRLRQGGDTFYLRLYRPSGRPLAQIAAEASLLTQFGETAHVDVSRPVATADGCHIVDVSFDGERRYACLFESADGEEIEFNAAHMQRFGASTPICKMPCRPASMARSAV